MVRLPETQKRLTCKEGLVMNESQEGVGNPQENRESGIEEVKESKPRECCTDVVTKEVHCRRQVERILISMHSQSLFPTKDYLKVGGWNATVWDALLHRILVPSHITASGHPPLIILGQWR
jgi:hypothetical protein